MLFFSQCHHQFEKGHLETDVTFTLSDVGLTRIYDDQNLVAFLTGQQYDEHLKIAINQQSIDLASDEGRSLWRKQYATLYHEVNAILREQTILENITLFYDDQKTAIYEALKYFDLQANAHDSCEEASFDVLTRMIFSRIYLRKTAILFVDTNALDYTKEEFEIFATQLTKMATCMQVIVFGDKELALPYTREITIRQGHLLADSGKEASTTMLQQPSGELQRSVFTQMMKQMHQRYSLPYHVLLFLFMISFFLVSVLLSGSSLNIENIQLSMLKREHQSRFEIKKYANDQQGMIYQIDDVMTKADMQLLSKDSDDFIYSYYPINEYYANAYLEGIYEVSEAPLYNQYPICELADVKQLGGSQIVGNFPKNDEEVMISYALASTFYSYSPQGMVGQRISWYGLPLTISGVYLDKHLQNEQCLYVVKGFMQQHPLTSMKVFQYGEKHLYYRDIHVLMSDFQELNPWALIYNGHKTIYAMTLKTNEVIIDIATAIDLGFPYEEIASNEMMSYEEKLQLYYQFIAQLIGKPLKVKVERLASTIDTTYYQENKIIAGSLIPSMDIMFQQTTLKPKVLYFKTGTLQDYMVENYYITKVQYPSQNNQQSKAMLKEVNEHSMFYADLKNTLLLKLLVSDVEELGMFFISMFLVFGLLAILLYRLLMRKTLYHNRKELRLIYGFGYSCKQIKEAFQQRFLNKIKHYLFISLCVSSILLAIYYFMIFIKLSWNPIIFVYMFIPWIIYVIYGALMMVVTKLYLNHFIGGHYERRIFKTNASIFKR